MNKQAALQNLKNTVVRVVSLLGAAMKYSPGQDVDSIMAEYQESIFSTMQDYLDSDKPITAYRNEFKRAINDSFYYAFIAGWADAGASGDLPGDAQDWLNGRIEAEIGFMETLFTELRELRANQEMTWDEKLDIAERHAANYAGALMGVYSYAKLMAYPEQDGVWRVGPTDHCETCAGLDGQVHPLSWYLANGYVPQEYGSRTLDCHGYNCQCTVRNPKTGRQLLP